MSKGTILIIEDQPGFRRIYHDVLTTEGFTVILSEDGEDGWEKVKNSKPNLVLLDLGLPKVDGFEVLKRIRADVEIKETPVIIFSVLGEQKDVKKGLEMGANDYTVKGFYTPRQVLAKIHALLAKAAAPKKVNSYKLKIDKSPEEVSRLQNEIGIAQGFQCPQCQSDMVLELIPDYTRAEGHWFTGHFVCSKCGKEF